MKYFVAMGILAFFGVSTASPAPTALYLYRNCQSQEPALKLECTVYIRGFLDGLQAGGVLAKENPPIFCPPKAGIPSDQGQLILEKYFREHPEELQEAAGPVAMAAILLAFRCNRGPN